MEPQAAEEVREEDAAERRPPPLPISPVVIIDIEREPEGGVVNPLAPQTPLHPASADETQTPTAPAATHTMDEGEGPSASRRQGVFCGSAGSSSASDSDTADDAPLLAGDSMSNECRVRIDTNDRPVGPHDRFPKERFKATMMALLLVFAAILNEVVLSFVHERIPDRTVKPLPDITFSFIPQYPKGLEICEMIMVASFVFTLILIFFHRHRWIVFRRLMTIGSLLYLMRCVTLLATQVPVADTTFKCLPKLGENATFWRLVERGLSQVVSLGLNVEQNAGVLCGDYIYSGHTIVLVVSALFISEYSPRRFWPLHWAAWLAAAVGVAFLVVSRGHYTIDVILSYFVCTRVFWNYHTMAAHPTLRNSTQNHNRKEFWFRLFGYLESSIQKPVPRRFDSPIQLDALRSLVLRRRNTNSRID